MNQTTKAYLAGFIDGERCITISRKKCNDGSRNEYQYRLYINISNTDKRVIDYIKSSIGLGNIHKQKRKTGHKQAYTLGLWSNKQDSC